MRFYSDICVLFILLELEWFSIDVLMREVLD